jgi:hypothetical protein
MLEVADVVYAPGLVIGVWAAVSLVRAAVSRGRRGGDHRAGRCAQRGAILALVAFSLAFAAWQTRAWIDTGGRPRDNQARTASGR